MSDEKTVQWTCNEIAEDMANDATAQPFNGLTVGTKFGNHGAAIAALARIVAKQDTKIERLESLLKEWIAPGKSA